MNKNKILILIVLGFVLTGCDRRTASEYLESAVVYQNKQDNTAALIELKSAAEKYPDNSKVRESLSKLLFDVGDYRSSIKEARRAMRLDKSREARLNPLIVVANYQLGEFENVVELTSTPNLFEKDPELKLLRYLSLLEVGGKDEANTLKAEVNGDGLAPDNLKILINAYSEKGSEDLSSTLKALEIISSPLKENWLALGRLYFINGAYHQSTKFFKLYANHYPGNFRAALYLANSMIRDHQLENAEKLLNELQTDFGQHPLVSLLFAELALLKKEFSNAKQYSDTAIARGLDIPRIFAIQAISTYELDLFETTYNALSSIPDEIERDATLQKIDLLVRAELGYSFTSMAAIQAGSETSHLAEKLSIELAGQGRFDLAKELFDQISQYETEGNANIRQAFLELGFGSRSKGVALLEDIIASKPNELEATFLIAQTKYSEGQFELAIEIAKEGLQIDDRYVPLLSVLITSLSRAGEREQARPFLTTLASEAPNHETLLLFELDGLLELNDSMGAISAIESFSKKSDLSDKLAIFYYALCKSENLLERNTLFFKKTSTRNVSTSEKLYIYSLLDEGNISEAETFLDSKDYDFSKPWHFEIQYDVNRKSGNYSKALSALNSWIASAQVSEKAFVYKVNLLATLNREQEALSAALDGAEKFVNSERLNIIVVELALSAYKLDIANRFSEKIKSESARVMLRYRLNGILSLRKGRVSEGLRLLSEYYRISDDENKVSKTVPIIESLTHRDVAISFMETELNHKANDIALLRYYGDATLPTAPRDSIAAYKKLIKLNAHGPRELNNLAWLLVTQGEPEEALLYINKALAFAPDNVQVKATYGEVLLANGKYVEALKVIEDVIDNSGAVSVSIQLNYVEALIKNQHIKKAKVLLKKIQKDNLPLKLIDRLNALNNEVGL